MVQWQTINTAICNMNHLSKIALNGDMARLPPTVISVGASECSNVEVVSFFERMITTGHPHTQLNVQYRMAPEIVSHVSNTSYNRAFITDESCENRENARMSSDAMLKTFGCTPGTSFFLAQVTEQSLGYGGREARYLSYALNALIL